MSRAPHQQVVHVGKQSMRNQMPLYNGGQQPFYPAPYDSYQSSSYGASQEVYGNVGEMEELRMEPKKTTGCSNHRIAIGVGCVIALLLVVAAFAVPALVLLLPKSDVSQSTSSLPFSGVQLNYNPSSLPSSWSSCYTGTYQSTLGPSNLPSILATCNKKMLLVGCRAAGNAVLDLAAVGLRADVLYNCTTIPSCRNVANGVGWYYSDVYSWGYANGNDNVTRNSCDVFSTNPGYRLCWHTSNGNGYRCGSTITSTSSYEKVIYHSD